MKRRATNPGVWVILASFALVLSACPSANNPAATQNAANQGDPCTTKDDCVLVRGNPCSRCGSCPGDGASVMSTATLQKITSTPECIAEQGPQPIPGQPPPPAPSCAPCVAGENNPTAFAKCLANHCEMRCSEQHVVGDKLLENEVACR